MKRKMIKMLAVILAGTVAAAVMPGSVEASKYYKPCGEDITLMIDGGVPYGSIVWLTPDGTIKSTGQGHDRTFESGVKEFDGQYILYKDGRLVKISYMGNSEDRFLIEKASETFVADNVKHIGDYDTATWRLIYDEGYNNLLATNKRNDGLFIIKNDNTLWQYERRGFDYEALEDRKLMDNVADVWFSFADAYEQPEVNRNLLVLKTDGSLWGMGNNFRGELGQGHNNPVDYTSPVKILDNVKTVSIDAMPSSGNVMESEGSRVYAVTKNGDLYTWGAEYYSGQFSMVPKKILENVESVSQEDEKALAVTTDHELYGIYESDAYPMDTNVIDAAQTYHTRYWLKDDNSLWYVGMRGISENTNLTTDTPRKLLDNIVYLCATSGCSIALDSEGYLWGWGHDGFNAFNQGENDYHSNGDIGPVRIKKIFNPIPPAGPDGQIYRLADPTNGDHIYTTNLEERNILIRSGWLQEPSPGMTEGPDGVPVYRLKNLANGEHLFTANKTEKDRLAKMGWSVENSGVPAFYGSKSGKAFYRLFNPKAVSAIDSHHYALDQTEIKQLTTKYGWVMDNGGKPVFYLR